MKLDRAKYCINCGEVFEGVRETLECPACCSRATVWMENWLGAEPEGLEVRAQDSMSQIQVSGEI